MNQVTQGAFVYYLCLSGLCLLFLVAVGVTSCKHLKRIADALEKLAKPVEEISPKKETSKQIVNTIPECGYAVEDEGYGHGV